MDALQETMDSPHSRYTQLNRLQENARAADIKFTAEEVQAIDEALDGMEMSEVFGGLKVKE